MSKARAHFIAATLAALSLVGTAAAQQQPAAASQGQTTALPAFLQQPAAQTTAQAKPTPDPNAGHEYAPLIEQKINYKDWTFKSLKDGAPVNLREFVRGKKLVMVVYFAPWCGNWKMEAPVVARLYEKYSKSGFDVVAVSEYASPNDTRKYFETAGAPSYTVVVESESREDRDKTTHYGYRQACGDARKWGSPFNIFLEPAKLNPSGDVLTERAWVVGGELIEKDVEKFIREKLGLAESASVSPCENKKP